tara:strand:- start:4851 stop:5822 length:972 start_codon:yes stop_codon:yes gene_type:complete
METKNFLPENDQDLQLALHLGITLESGESISSIQDPVIQSLLAFKSQEHTEIEELNKYSDDIWNLIDKEISTAQNAKILSLKTRKPNTWAWATAATVLIATFVGIFWFTTLQEPTLIAQSKSRIEIVTLADGSQISLRPNSSLYEITLSESKRAYKLDGEAFFTVAKDVDRPFSVHTNSATITVLGTQFNVSTWGKVTNVFLEEGSVRLDVANTNSVILKPGEKATISDSGIAKPVSTDGTEFKDWLENTLVLKSTPIAQVIAELEHHYTVGIDISQMENKSELITGSIPLTDLSATLNDLGIILGGTFRKVNSNSFVFIPLN